MKKVLTALLALLLVCSAAFAADETPVTYGDIDFTFNPTTARYDGMGQSGLADSSRIDSFFSNPANLSQDGFALSIPSVALTVYNFNALISDPEAMETVNKLVDGTASNEETTSLALKFVGNLGKGYNTVLKMDAGAALKVGPFGLGGTTQLKIHALNEGTSVASQKLIPELNLAGTVAFGMKAIDTDVVTVSGGVSFHGIYKAYFKAIGANTAVSLMSEEDIVNKLLWDYPIMAGYALTLDSGITVGLWRDQISLAVTANNINGVYKMQSYTSVGHLVNTLSEGTLEEPAGHPANTPVEFEVQTPWTLNFGFAFKPNMALVHPTVTADLVDMLGMIQSFNSDTFRASDLLLHLNAGAEVDLFNMVKVRAGINRGYWSVGAGLNLFVIGVDASYGWQEFGAEMGDKPVDSFTIKFNIGFDK